MATDFSARKPLDVTWDDVFKVKKRSLGQRLVRVVLRVCVMLAVLFSVLIYSLHQAATREVTEVQEPRKKPRVYWVSPPLQSAAPKEADGSTAVSRDVLCKKMSGWARTSALQLGQKTSVFCQKGRVAP